MAYIGNSAANQTFTPVIDTFNGNGSTTAFTLTYPVASVAQVEAYISNVPQQPGVAYTVLGNTITFTSAPPSGTANIYVRYTSPITQIMQPGAGTVTPSSLSSGGPSWTSTGKLGTGIATPLKGLHAQSNASEDGRTLRLAYDNTFYTDIAQLGAGGVAVRNNNTNDLLKIDGAGRVTMPYQPMFSTSRTGGSVTGGTTATVIVFDNNMVNVGGHYNNTNGRFTAPIAGTYYFSACGMLDTSSVSTADTQMVITVNGSSMSISNPPMSGSSQSQGMGFAASVAYTLAAGDYVDVRFYSSSGTNKFYGAGGRFNNFSGFLIG